MATVTIPISTRNPAARKQQRDSFPLTFAEARETPGVYEDDDGGIVMISEQWDGKVNVNFLGTRSNLNENSRRELPATYRYRKLNVNASIVVEGMAD